ncbi:MAG TPA: hypothetical protein PK566_17280, partial [Pseudobacteroides sp.]|nr:hypothetical protein [Pseudobacteroides sp.]
MAKLPFEYVKKPDIDWIEEEKKRREQEEKLQRVQNYFAGVAQNSINLQNEANFYQKYAEERKDLLKSIDKPTPQEVEQVNPLSSILNYTPVNPNYTLNWANAISSWAGNKPTYQTWNPDFDANYNQVLINKLNEAHEHKIIANKKPENRTPEEFEKLSSFVANKIKSGEYSTAKKILQSMPENYKLLPPEEKLKQIQGTTPIEQAYLNWKQNYLAKIKKGEEERYNQMNIGEKMMKDSENIEGNDWYSNFKRELLGGIGSVIHNVYSPIKGGVEKVNKAVEAPPSAKNLINTVGGFIDTVFSIGMAPLNAMTGLAQKSLVKDQYNLLNNATMQLLGMPGEAVAKVAEKLGVEDPELLQSLSTLGNTAAMMLGPAMKGRLAKGIQEGVMKKVAEYKKLNEMNQLQKLDKAVDPAGALKEVPKPESLPIGEQLIKEALEVEKPKAETKPIEQKGIEATKPVTEEVKPTTEPIPKEAVKSTPETGQPIEAIKETPQKSVATEEAKPIETTTTPEGTVSPKETAIPEINKAKIEELTKQRDLADKEAAMLLEDESMFDPKEVAELKERVKQTGKTEREYAVEKLNEVEKLDEQIKELEKSRGVIDSGYIPEEVKPIEEAKPTEAIKPEEAVKPVEEVKPTTEPQPQELAKPIPEEVKPQESVKPIEEIKTPETVEPIKEIKVQEAAKPQEAVKPTTETKPAEVKPQEKPAERPSFAEEYSKRFRISHLQESFFKIVAEAYEDPVRRAKGEHIQHIDNFIKKCQEAQKNGSLIGNDELVKNLANPEFAANFKQEILNDLPKYYETYKQKYGIIENENTGVKLDEAKGTQTNKVVEVNTKDINIHPKMQFKSLADESGVTKRDRLEAQEYNPAYAGVYAVWEDPKTGKTYVVDGHHRLDLAKRKGVEKVPAYYIEAKDINDARAQGAMINIANNRGIPIDVARISKENGWGVEDFKKNNIDVKNSNVLKQGMELAKLSDDLLDKVEKSYLYDKTKSIVDNNLLPEKYAVIIGEEAPIPLELSQKKANKKTPMNELAEYEKIATIQRQAFEYLKENPKVDPETFREIIREKVNSGTAEKTGEQSSMFGELTTKYENERAELRADFEKQINYDISTSNIVKNTKKAKSIQEKGLGELKTEEGKKLNEELNRIKEVYTKEKYSGELAQLTNEYAKKLSEVKNDRAGREQIKREFNERVREAIRNRYREEGQNVAEHKGVPDSSTSLFGEPEKTTTATTTEAPKQLRKIEEIPLEKDKAENFNVG